MVYPVANVTEYELGVHIGIDMNYRLCKKIVCFLIEFRPEVLSIQPQPGYVLRQHIAQILHPLFYHVY